MVCLEGWLPTSNNPTRRPNNHTAALARQFRQLARDVIYCYGHRFQPCVDYLEAMADNSLWSNAQLAPLPWHSEAAPAQPGIAEPRYVMHQSVLNCLAPSVPLRAIFGGDRHV